jgi:electron transport complex protein RnfB
MSLVAALLVMVVLVTLAAFAIGVSATRAAGSREDEDVLIDRIDALLPQTQCGRCTFTGCRPYATALARGEADINQCPPGGEQTMQRLARLLGHAPRAVDERFGIVPATPRVAWIDEPRCIGCTKCIQACPVDAIVGASKYMHTVIAEDCTGCELCIPPCPVDCIEMRPAPAPGINSRPRFSVLPAAELVE